MVFAVSRADIPVVRISLTYQLAKSFEPVVKWLSLVWDFLHSTLPVNYTSSIRVAMQWVHFEFN